MDPLPPFLHHQDGEIRLVGSRITLFHIVKDWREGASAEQIALDFPGLPLAQVKQVLAFYHANRPAVDEYVRQYQAVLDAQYAAGRKLSLAELRARAATGVRR
jgi:uncharacterized protein (DUF433 family)